MSERADNKIKQIETFLEELSKFIPPTLEEYILDLGAKAICERYFEKIAEAIADLALLFIKENNLQIPETEKETFDVLAISNVIPYELAKKLSNVKGMRNFISHQYGEINDELVFHAVKEELTNDVNTFLEAIIKKHKK